MSSPAEKNPGEPIAWMRRWYFEGEAEYSVLNSRTGRMKRHAKFMWLPVTPGKIIPDDVPLYAGESKRTPAKKREKTQ